MQRRSPNLSEATFWQSSQRAHAMDHATEQFVRGDFNDATFEYAGTRSRFFREDKKFLVETDGPDGKLATFEVKYTFGVDPLQQYLIEFADGRIQALSIAWAAAIKTNLREKFGGVRYGARPTYALVEAVGKKVVVKINDVGPLTRGRIIDLNERAMCHFDLSLELGVIYGVRVSPLSGDHWIPGPVG